MTIFIRLGLDSSFLTITAPERLGDEGLLVLLLEPIERVFATGRDLEAVSRSVNR